MSIGRSVLGVLLVAVGTLAFLDAAGVADGSSIAAAWWPVALIALGGAQVVVERRVRVASVVLVVGGAVVLAATTGALTGTRATVIWPLLLIAAGLWIVLGRPWAGSPITGDRPSHVAVLTVSRLMATSRRLERADVTSVLSSVRLDLARALPAPGGATISATAVLGSIDVIVPEGWRVEMRGIPILGGWDDTTSREPVAGDAPLLRIRALVVLGGVDVRHRNRWA